MFGIGMPELLVILGLALIILGPKKLPEIARGLGKAMREFRRATDDLKEQFEEETKELKDVTDTIKEEVSLEEEGEFGLEEGYEPTAESEGESRDEAMGAPREKSREEVVPSPDSSDEVEVSEKKGGDKGDMVPNE
ncbi:MAG: twin-arginine translocase subunit TatB [Deltaproteobacteria bacterium]|nr:twin-arginine translocase subunit TatB [Deltaproteobacteria bacterium]